MITKRARIGVWILTVLFLVGGAVVTYMQFVPPAPYIGNVESITVVDTVADLTVSPVSASSDTTLVKEIPFVVDELLSPEALAACTDQAKAAECSFLTTENETLFGNCHEPVGESTLVCIPLQVN